MFAKRRKNQDIFYMMGQEKIIGHFCTYIYMFPHGPKETVNEIEVYITCLWYLHREISDIVN